MRYLILILCFLSAPAWAQKLSLNDLSSYLNGIKSAQGTFTQINGDGTIATGRILLKRPGRVRFEYNPPEKSLVIAGGGQVALFDPKSNDGPTRYPLNQTPLSVILARNVNLSSTNMVVGHGFDGTATTVVAQDPERPEYGNIRLIFTGNPVQLRQWVIDDNAGNLTTVVLQDFEKSSNIPERKFNIIAEMQDWNP